MTPERYQRVVELFHAALELEPGARSAFLSQACASDEELRQEVEAMLAADAKSRGFLDQPPDDLAAAAMRAGGSGSVIDRPAWEAAADLLDARTVVTPGTRLGPYEILDPLGEGGMGTVYRGLDTRLNRPVAVKFSSEQFSQRFEREARVISALNHPHICTLYDVGAMPSGSSFMVTELVEGETLRDWLKRAPAMERSLEIARQVLEALRAAHQAGIIHRDLKPANIMVRFDGYVKVLDFGIAKRMPAAGALQTENTATTGVSLPGQVLGTVPYMSPEQILSQQVDQRSDLFAFGIILHEMLAGEHPWPRKSGVDTLHAILHEDPPPIQSTALKGLAAISQKLLRKNPAGRYPSAEAVLEALANRSGQQTPQRPELEEIDEPERRPRALTRLIVLPFRMLRRHEATDFLAVSLPDAISSSLAAIDALVVRSTMLASRFGVSTEIDVHAIAEQAQVDAILTGTILSDGEHLRVTTQLVEAPSGVVLWSNASQVTLHDIFHLQDELVDRIVQSLALPLTDREHRALKHDVPMNAVAYELYLRANQLAAVGDVPSMIRARDLYLRCVDAEPKYAPAWACLGRTYRFIGKYGEEQAVDFGRAEKAFRKAFVLNPELALAHNLYTALETDLGRSLDAMERLLMRAHTHRNDSNLLTGLVQACRYCGLLKASVAAHDRARRLDPHVRTSVAYTFLQLGDFQSALDYSGPTDGYIFLPSLLALGRKGEAIEKMREIEKALPTHLAHGTVAAREWLEGDREKSLEALDRLEPRGFHTTDPEARFRAACFLAELNEPDRALEYLSLALDSGYRCHYALLHDPWLDSVRAHPQFTALVNRAAPLDLEARTVFLDNGGDRLLGLAGARAESRP